MVSDTKNVISDVKFWSQKHHHAMNKAVNRVEK